MINTKIWRVSVLNNKKVQSMSTVVMVTHHYPPFYIDNDNSPDHNHDHDHDYDLDLVGTTSQLAHKLRTELDLLALGLPGYILHLIHLY